MAGNTGTHFDADWVSFLDGAVSPDTDWVLGLRPIYFPEKFKRLTREVAPNEATSHPSALRVNEYTGMKKDTPVTDW